MDPWIHTLLGSISIWILQLGLERRYFILTPTITSAPVLLPALLEQVPIFADEARLSLELDSKEPKNAKAC